MTILVFNDRFGAEVMTSEWTATRDITGDTYLGYHSGALENEVPLFMPIEFVKFIDIIKEGGKVIDLRGIQENPDV
jgi:hypothetical protein